MFILTTGILLGCMAYVIFFNYTDILKVPVLPCQTEIVCVLLLIIIIIIFTQYLENTHFTTRNCFCLSMSVNTIKGGSVAEHFDPLFLCPVAITC